MRITRLTVLKVSWVVWAISFVFAVAAFFFEHGTPEYHVIDIGWWVSSALSLALFVYSYLGRFEK